MPLALLLSMTLKKVDQVKYFLLALTLQIFSFQVLAAKIQSQIHSLDKGTNGEPHLVKLTSGQVAFLEFEDKTLLKQIEASLLRKDWLELTLGNSLTLQSIQIIAPQYEPNYIPGLNESTDPYVPTVMTLTKAQSIFSKMRRNYQADSQCFNRAHVWTYEEFTRSQANLNKVFLFFTNRYIRNYRFHWWFHVTPMTYVGGTRFSNWKMLDRKYTSGPLSPKTWTDIFMKSNRSCPVVAKYSEYREHQTTEDCYMFPASMYYVVPSDLERLERTGEERTSYDPDDVDYALYEAF